MDENYTRNNNTPVQVIELYSDEDDEGEAPIPSYPPRSPSMLSTCSDFEAPSSCANTASTTAPETVRTVVEEVPTSQPSTSRSPPQQMPPPRQRSVSHHGRREPTSFRQPQPQPPFTATRFNIFLQTVNRPLQPVFHPSDEDEDSDSVVFEKEVPNSMIPVSWPSTSRQRFSGPTPESVRLSRSREGLPMQASATGENSAATSIMTPPPTPPCLDSAQSPRPHNEEVSTRSTRPSCTEPKSPKRAAPSYESLESTTCASKLISPLPTTATAEKASTSTSPPESEAANRLNDRESQTSAQSEKSSTVTLIPETCKSEVTFEGALNELVDNYAGYVKATLMRRYKLSLNEDKQKVIQKLQRASKGIKTGKNCLRQILSFHHDIDPRNFDSEIKWLCEEQKKKQEREERDRLLNELADELRNLESQLKELEKTKSHGNMLNADDAVLWDKTTKSLGKRFVEYKKKCGDGNDVLECLHGEVLRTIHLDLKKDDALCPEIKDAVEQYLESRKKSYLHGHMKKFEEMPYPDFEELMKVVTDTSSLYTLGYSIEEGRKIAYKIYKFMVSKIKYRRVRDFHDYLFVYTQYSRSEFKEELTKDPSNDPGNEGLRISLHTNGTTAESNLSDAYDKLCACTKREVEVEGSEESSDESEDEDSVQLSDDEMTQADLDFIDNSENVDRVTPKSSHRSQASTSTGIKTRSKRTSVVSSEKQQPKRPRRIESSGSEEEDDVDSEHSGEKEDDGEDDEMEEGEMDDNEEDSESD